MYITKKCRRKIKAVKQGIVLLAERHSVFILLMFYSTSAEGLPVQDIV